MTYHVLSINPEDPKPWKQEIDAILNIANTISGLVDPSNPLDASSLQLNTLSPTNIKSMLKAINSSDIACDAIPGFISSGFESINLGTLTTYNEVNYATYHLGQVVYGGLDGLASEGTEIDNIYRVMNSIYNESAQTYDTNLNDMSSFAAGEGGLAKLEGLLRFIYKSHIFDTNHTTGEYHLLNSDGEGHSFSAQGIMLYHSLGESLSYYIARDADPSTPEKAAIDRIATLSTIVHMNYYEENYDLDTYAIEAKGLKSLLNSVSGTINASTFEGNDVETIKASKALIMNIIESAYNADGEDHYSAIVSEFVSGLLNYIMENQYNAIHDDPSTYPGYAYQVFSFGNDDASSLTLDDYSDLNQTEKNGANGVISSLDIISGGMSPASLKAAREDLKNDFALMGEEEGKNSHLAQILYLSQAHRYLNNIPFLNTQLVTVLTADPEVPNNVYSNTFSFKEYGENLDSFIGLWL